jgi:phage baseplate assembly protein W
MNIAFPYQFDSSGRTAQANPTQHIQDLIQQVLFTAPGERVNQPDFGCGLLQMVFAPNSAELLTASQFLIQGALQLQLGDIITLNSVNVSANQSSLTVIIQYTVRSTQQQQVVQFSTGGAAT